MRIVDVCAFYTPAGGGVRTYVDAKLKAASRAGHEIIVIAPGERDETVRRGPGAFLVTIPSPTLPLDRRYRYFHDESAIHRALDAWSPDHVEASSPWTSAAMVGRWQGAASRSLVMHCDPLAAYAYRWLGNLIPTHAIDRLFGWFWQHLRRLDEMFDIVVCANAQLARRLGQGGVGKSEAIGMGVESGVFSPSLRSPELRAMVLNSVGLPADSVLLIGIGRFSAEKRWEMVVRAAGRLNPHVGLLLVGDGPKRSQLEHVASRAGNVRVIGPVDDRLELARLLASADALVHGCEAETFCMVAAEARASGIPLIVPDGGGAADHPIQGAGFAYRAGNRRSLEDAIRHFVESGPELQRARATSHCEVRTMDQHFDQLFERYAMLRAATGETVANGFEESLMPAMARVASSSTR
jgi:alpha-1,6-mannosyltransferase